MLLYTVLDRILLMSTTGNTARFCDSSKYTKKKVTLASDLGYVVAYRFAWCARLGFPLDNMLYYSIVCKSQSFAKAFTYVSTAANRRMRDKESYACDYAAAANC